MAEARNPKKRIQGFGGPEAGSEAEPLGAKPREIALLGFVSNEGCPSTKANVKITKTRDS